MAQASTLRSQSTRARLSRWRDLNPPPPIQRYEHPRPGDLLQHPGFLALHVAVDDHSRLAFTQMLPDQKVETTVAFLAAATDFFATHGIGVRALLTDNGSSYRFAQFHQACQNLQIKHRRTWPYTPRTNGKAERFIQTALSEWAYAQHWSDSEQRDVYLQPWTDFYNRERPHGNLNYKPPISRSDSGTTS